MPYGMRVVAAVAGGVMLIGGAFGAVEALRGLGHVPTRASIAGLGLGLLAAAFVRPD